MGVATNQMLIVAGILITAVDYEIIALCITLVIAQGISAAPLTMF